MPRTRPRLPKPPHDSLECLRIHEVAALCHVSCDTVRAWTRKTRKGKGSFPLPIRASDAVLLWPRADIARWMSEVRS